MSLIHIIFTGISLFLLTVYLVKKFISIAYKFNIIDLPNHRSSHTYPVARGGGIIIAILSGLLMIILIHLNYLSFLIGLILSGAFIVAFVGFIDDVINLSIAPRLLIQFIASALTAGLVMSVNSYTIDCYSFSNLIIFVFLVIAIIWSTNLFNFMDGTDGIASLEAIFVLTAGGLLLIAKGVFLGKLLILIASIVGGFLWCNFPPAKIFMGDVGSYFLGFLIGSVILISCLLYKTPILFWLIIYSVFCFDSTATLCIRFCSGEKWYLPHRSHAYQKLQNFGWTHKNILCGLFVLNSIFTSIAFVAYCFDQLLIAIAINFTILIVIYLTIWFKNLKYAKNF